MTHGYISKLKVFFLVFICTVLLKKSATCNHTPGTFGGSCGGKLAKQR